MEYRSGIGYDLHPLKKGKPLILGGIPIPHAKGLVGHSDGDVLLHAISDALLGAACLGDLGTHFPDSEATWKDAPSRIFLEKTRQLVEKKFKIRFVDSIVIAETPKLSPFFQKIRQQIAHILNVPVDRISVKAKTHEKLGPIGQGKAMAAFASVTLAQKA